MSCLHAGERSIDRATGDEQCLDCGAVNPVSRWKCGACGELNSEDAPSCYACAGKGPQQEWCEECEGTGYTIVLGTGGGAAPCTECDAGRTAAEQERLLAQQPVAVIPAGTVLSIEQPEPHVLDKLRVGLEGSGMVFGECSFCGRPYGSRDGSPLCPPCKGVVPYDGWHATHPDSSPFVQRSRLLSLLLLRASERLEIMSLAHAVYEDEELQPELMHVTMQALEGGDEHAWKQSLWALYVREHGLENVKVDSIKSEVHVEVSCTAELMEGEQCTD